MGFEDPNFAIKLRDVVKRIATDVVRSEAPQPRYGVVAIIDEENNRVRVLFRGTAQSVWVRAGARLPLQVGQIVRVGGRAGDHYIIEIVGRTAIVDYEDTLLAQPINLFADPSPYGAILFWEDDFQIMRYEVHIWGGTLDRSFIVHEETATVDGLRPGTSYTFRVRAVSSHGARGPWSDEYPFATTMVQPDDQGTDGDPPESSPQPVITEGMGFLVAEWEAISNPDPVMYEVHISTQSGFQAAPGTFLAQTSGTFYFITKLPDGSPLDYDTTYFIRLIAKDADGSAPIGPQGYGSPRRVETEDVGEIDLGDPTDGDPPSSSPTPSVTNGIGYLFLRWDHIENADPVTYEVYLVPYSQTYSDGSQPTGRYFDIGEGNFIGTTPSNWFFARNVGSGQGGGPLVYGETYYVIVRATDADGAASGGDAASGSPVKVDYTDIADDAIRTPQLMAGAITAGSAIIADAAIDDAHIASLDATKIDAGTLDASLVNVINLNASNITVGEMSGARIQAGTLTVTDGEIISLNAAKITAGILSANRIGVGSLTVRHLAIEGVNQWPDPFWYTNTSTSFYRTTSAGTWAVETATTESALTLPAQRYLVFDALGVGGAGPGHFLGIAPNLSFTERQLHCSPGDEITVSFRAGRNIDGSDIQIAPVIQFRDRDGSDLVTHSESTAVPAHWTASDPTRYLIRRKAPQNAAFAVGGIMIYSGGNSNGKVRFNHFFMGKSVSSFQLGHETITVDEIKEPTRTLVNSAVGTTTPSLTYKTIAETSLSVPTWAEKANVIVVCSSTSMPSHSTGFASYNVRGRIAGQAGPGGYIQVNNTTMASLTVSHVREIIGPGASITSQVQSQWGVEGGQMDGQISKTVTFERNV